MKSRGDARQNEEWKFYSLNKYLSVRFEKDETIIFVKEERFDTCKCLLMSFPIDTITLKYKEEYQSLDDLTQQYENKKPPAGFCIEPEEEFKGHCSNLQAWVDNDYNTRLLDKKLAFPLLKKLVEAGDLLAQKVLPRDIVSRFNADNLEVRKYLIEGGYLTELNQRDLEGLLEYEKYEMFVESLSKSFAAVDDHRHHAAILIRFLEKNTNNHPFFRRAHLVLAFVYIAQREFSKARSMLKELLLLYPEDPEANFFLAQTYWFEGETENAKKALNPIVGQRDLINYDLFMEVKDRFYSSLVEPKRTPRFPHMIVP